jgi:hypothetical protein
MNRERAIRKAIHDLPLLLSETDNGVAKLAIARALALCESEKARATIRAMGMSNFMGPSIDLLETGDHDPKQPLDNPKNFFLHKQC